MARYGRIVFVCLVVTFAGAIAFADDAGAPTDWTVPARACKKKNPVPADAASIAAGQEIYEANCVSCHGAAGDGNGPRAAELDVDPCNLHDPTVQAQTDGSMFWKLSTGKTPMPKFEKLLPDETDRWKVINFVRTFAPPATQPASQN